jgi:bacterioferritin-associated ferredoxin
VIVCICHAVPETALREAAALGLPIEEVVRETGAGTSCGCCADQVAEILARHQPCDGQGSRQCPGCPRAAARLDVSNQPEPVRGEAA